MSQESSSTTNYDESPEEYAKKDEEEAETDYMAPSHWWFVTTLFPLLGATFGPIASAFNICAIYGRWVVTVNPNSAESEGIYIHDPAWLYAVNAISLAIALLGNLALLAQMTGRLSFSIAQPITLFGFFAGSFLLVGIVVATPMHLQRPGQTLSQAYYYAAMAAVLYFILGCLLLTTAWGVWIGRFSREYKLTMAQRSLMFQTTLFVGYLLASAAVYSRIENWYFLDALYWADVTLFTIGFGDFAPKTHLGRSLFFPFAVGGILFVGLIVSSITACVLESGSRKVSARNLEKARQSVMKNMDPKSGGIRVSWFQKKKNIASKGGSELAQREHEFDLMRLVQQKAAFDNSVVGFCFSLGLWLFLWFFGAIVFWQAEQGFGDWTYFEALYFTYVSYLTIGYGDFEPNTNSSKPAFVMWSLLALPTLTVLIGALGGVISESVNSLTLWIAQNLPESSKWLRSLKHGAQAKKMDKDGDYSAAKPPGFMEDGRSGADPNGQTAQESEAVRGMGGSVQAGRGATSSEANAAQAFRPQLLIRQIKQVIEHQNSSPPRKYSFSEWVWMLKLLGEDENDPKYHRSARDVEGAENDDSRINEEAKEGDALDTGMKWSWLGRKSPLMAGQDEPGWVLGKLIRELERELEELGRKREEGKST